MSEKNKHSGNKRKVKKRYNELSKLLNNDKSVMLAQSESESYNTELEVLQDEILFMTHKYKSVMEKSSNLDNLIDGLSIDNLNDLTQIEKTGKLNKIKFNDIVEAGKLRLEALNSLEDQALLASKAKLSKIDLLQAKIKILLKEIS